MKKFLITALLFPLAVLANPIDDNCPEHVIHGAPISSITENTQYICHGNYAIHYRYDTKTAEYVVEHLDDSDINGPAKRRNDFRQDPKVDDDKEATLEDYKGHPYDRGHLVPAADNRTDREQMSESFYLTNMVPQDPGNNRVIWRILELGVRNTAAAGNDIYVSSGTIYEPGHLTIGNGVGVPTKVWKVVYNHTTGETIAFIFPNKKYKAKDIPKFVVTVDEVEAATGINFFPELDESAEASYDVTKWPEIIKE
jgi:endonuclease G